MVKKTTDDESVASEVPDFSWAANVVKLNRAKAHVKAADSSLKGKEYEAAVKERYLETNGLLVGDRPEKGSKSGAKVQNLADHDGTPDTE